MRRRDGADEDRRDAEADDVRERLDVVRRARDEVAGAGPLDGRQRQLDDPAHELLAQLGEDRLAHDERGPAGEPRDDGLHDDGAGDPERERVDDLERPPVADLVDEQADDARRRRAPRRRRRSAADDPKQAAAVPAQQAAACGLGPTPCRRRAGCGVAGGGVSGISPPPLGRRCAGSRDRAVMSSRWVPVGDGPAVAQEDDVVGPVEDERARRHDDGRAPGRGPRRGVPAMRASVWASTALVGSTSTRVSASVSSARVSARRWRWPPEKARPRSSTSLSRPPGSASSTSSPLATESAARIVASSCTPHGSSSSRRVPGEEARVGLGDDDAAPQVGERRIGEPGAAERASVSSAPKRPSRSARAAESSGRADTTTVRAPGLDADAAARLDEPGRATPAGDASRRGLTLVGLHSQDPDELARADVGPGGTVDHLGRGAQRDRRGRRCSRRRRRAGRRVISPCDGEARAQPHDDEHEDAGQQHLRGVEGRLVAGDAVADGAHGLRLRGIPLRKVCSPPMPRSTRSPATVSAPSPMSRPASSRCASWRSLQRTDDEAEARRRAPARR